MSTAQSLVDWSLAERVATALAGDGPAWNGPDEDLLREESRRAARLVRRYTRLRRGPRLPEAELIDRSGWIRSNLESFRGISAEVERVLAGRVSDGSGEVDDGGKTALGRISATIAATATGIEAGLVTGYLAQRVVGQYDVALLGPVRQPRLLFVAPNLASARKRLDADGELFARWIALHEVTHAVQFSSVGWLRGHLGSLASQLLAEATVRVSPGEALAKLAKLSPGELARSVSSGELVTLLWRDSQKELLAQLMAAMTVVEGYAEHVMDAVGAELDPRYADLRGGMDSERERRGPLDSAVAKLLGLDLKMEQYRRGKVFCDHVAGSAGIRMLNRVWSAPAALPSAEELADPDAWVTRMARRREQRLVGLFSRS